MKKMVNGTLMDMTAEDIAQYNIDQANAPSEFSVQMEYLREKRDMFLKETDFYALSDVTMSSAMTTYRQALRDITNGLTTVEDIEDVVFPEKPEA
tara:strand:+ start:192 stop:476 length:285 start_codon:yes stop_codon:yes gene_type:complete